MPNFYGVPEITPSELAKKLAAETAFILLDVRETYELSYARINDKRMLSVPLSEIAKDLLDALPAELEDREASVIVMCHHGVRSAQVTAWLRSQGWQDALNLDGGIDAYARQVDRSVGLY